MEAFIVTRIAIAGGTGLVGRYAKEARCRAGRDGHLGSCDGLDLLAGAGLADALRGERRHRRHHTPAAGLDEARAFCGAVTGGPAGAADASQRPPGLDMRGLRSSRYSYPA